jgi:hypothetical protein
LNRKRAGPWVQYRKELLRASKRVGSAFIEAAARMHELDAALKRVSVQMREMLVRENEGRTEKEQV